MPKFQVGQKVRCVDACQTGLTVGRIYEVTNVRDSVDGSNVEVDKPLSGFFYEYRFVAVDEPTESVEAPAVKPETWTGDRLNDLQLAYDGARRACIEKEDTIEALRFDLVNLNKTIADKDVQIVELNHIQRIAADKIVALEAYRHDIEAHGGIAEAVQRAAALEENNRALTAKFEQTIRDLQEEQKQRKNFENAADQLADDVKKLTKEIGHLKTTEALYEQRCVEADRTKQAIVDAAEAKQTELEIRIKSLDMANTDLKIANDRLQYVDRDLNRLKFLIDVARGTEQLTAD